MLTLNGNWLPGPSLAAMLGISPDALRMRRMREGRNHPHYVRVGCGSVLYDRAAAERYAASCRAEQAA